MNDFQLSRNFWLHEAPCWWNATEADAAKLQETAARVLQPIRNEFGPVLITSWKWWTDGCTPRTGSHSAGGTVDFVTPDADMEQVWEWGNTHLMPSGYVGRWIYEPNTATKGEHIHIAPRADMIQVFSDSTIKSLRELPNGSTYVYQEWTAGTFVNPYQLEPLVVTATAGGGWLLKFLGIGLLFGLFTVDMAGQSRGGIKLKSTF